MVDTTATKFHDYVYTWDASDFSAVPTSGGQGFSLNAGTTPDSIYIDGMDEGPYLSTPNGAGFANYVVADPEFSASTAEYVQGDLSQATQVTVEEMIDFTGPDGQTYWMAHITGTDTAGNPYDTYVSNHTLLPGETYTSVGVDTSPNAWSTAPDYQSLFPAPRTDFVASPTGPASVDGEVTGGSETLAAWAPESLIISNSGTNAGDTITIVNDAKIGKFVTRDNDNYINDGSANYSSYANDTSQVGDYILSDGTVVAEKVIYQAESGYLVQDSSGQQFQITLITFGDEGGEGGRMYFSEDLLRPGETYTMLAAYDGTPGQDNNNLAVEYETAFKYTELVPCYTTGTAILAQSGEVAIETIRAGDLVKTASGEFKPVRWIDGRRIEKAELEANPKLYPVVITAGALGNGLPKRDLVVSRQHRIMVRSELTKAVIGTDEALIPAIKLTKLDGIYVDESVEYVEYVHLLLDEHEAIIAEGAAAESLYLGEMTLTAFDDEALIELLAIFPDLGTIDFEYVSEFAMPANKFANQLVAQHLANNAPLYVAAR